MKTQSINFLHQLSKHAQRKTDKCRTQKCYPYMDSPPLPVPVGSPPCTMKSCANTQQHSATIHEHEKGANPKPDKQSFKICDNCPHLDDSVKLNVVVVAPARELDEVPASSRRMLEVELEGTRDKNTIKSLRTLPLEDKRIEGRHIRATSTVKEPMEVSRVTSGGPPSALAHIFHFTEREIE